MMTPPSDNISRKLQIRAEARRLRRELSNKNERNAKIATSLRMLPEYINAKTILFYVDADSEVSTLPLIIEALRLGRRVVVPYCNGEELRLFWLEDISELEPGAFGIKEPLPRLRNAQEKSIVPTEIDLALVPGVAFDSQGRRIGQGKGYYDRFLKTLDPHTISISLAYQCQIFASIPVEPHDIPVDIIVTENNIYPLAPDTRHH